MHEQSQFIVAWASRSSVFMLVAALTFSAAIGCSPKTKAGPDKRPIETQPTTQPTHKPAASAEPMPIDEAMKLIDARATWTDLPPIDVPRHPAEKYLRGMVIVIDPGHGGIDGGDSTTQPSGYKAGPTGVKEAHMNLRVSLLLRALLADAGAIVVMTREGDDTISLKQRAEVANQIRRPDGGKGADLFISVHHNADGPKSNYTSIWYHGTVDNNEVELDVAQAIGHELGAAIRTDVGRTSPVLSSHLMYPSGFGVLRACNVPAILCECSFYTVREEEQRLRDAGYNLREAYGIYRGLCEYAYGGRPTQSAPVIERGEGSKVVLVTTLNDGLPRWWGVDRPRILKSTVDVEVNDEEVLYAFDPVTKELRASFEVSGPQAVVEIHHQNMFKHSNWPQRYAVRRAGGSEALTVEALPPIRDTYRAPASKPATAAAAAQ
jgi:N-acetylmuramoyl-L-alanine amidase